MTTIDLPARPAVEFVTVAERDTVALFVTGQLTTSSAGAFIAAAEEAVAAAGQVTVDVAGVTRCDSTCFAMLRHLSRRAAAAGVGFEVRRARPHVAFLADLAGIPRAA